MRQKDNTLSIQFLGATETVTGSKFLIEAGNKKILIDCGLFQGLKELRLRNWNDLPIDASTINYVILTHGHLDHVGYLPLLVKQGFSGSIYASKPTLEIAKLILLDSAKIQEEDAERANHYHYSKHTPAKPLYDTKEAEAVFSMFFSQPINTWITLDSNISFRLHYNGHILGACSIELIVNTKRFVFSGDIGRFEDPLLKSPEYHELADVLVIESTYGNRMHPKNIKENLALLIQKAIKNNGTIIIPSFAVERTQLLMYLLWQLKTEHLISGIPIYMDSPMGTHVLKVFNENLDWHKISEQQLTQIFENIKLVKDQNETQNLIKNKTPKIIIASSGMATGGRVLTYFEHYLGDEHATILLAGYQGEGTRGRALLDGAKEIKMRGKLWKVKANVELIEGLSAHADQLELIKWLSQIKNKPSKIFIVHGEKESSKALEEKIKEIYNWDSYIPKLNEKVIL